MKDKINIDKLFDQGFKNFEATPSPRVWENIQAELNKKKRNRKPIPLWIKYGGVAALLALLLTVGNWIYTPIEQIPNSITNENIVDPVEKIQGNEDIPNSELPESQVATEQDNNNILNESAENVITSTDTTFKNDKNSESVRKSTKTAIATNKFENNQPITKERQHKNLKGQNYPKTNTNKEVAISENSSELTVNKYATTDIRKNTEKENLEGEGNKIIFKEVDGKISVAKKSEEIKKEDPAKTETGHDSKNKKSILDAIAEKEEVEEDLLENKKQIPEQRWNVTPNVAPVYYSSFGNGSSIDPDFDNNPQKGDVNMSYGLQVSYALSPRLSVRTGLNNVDLSYSTSDILIGTGPVSDALSSVDYGGKQIVVTAINRSSLNTSGTNNFGDITLKSTSGDARLIQNINYYEVPLELKYAVINNKFGVNIIGGLSTMFLGNNEISVKADNFSSVLGEANNLSSVSFSTNVGLGLDYKLSKKFIFNIEPMFKYQLNPYTDSSVNFKPYYLGVYSGLSFKF